MSLWLARLALPGSSRFTLESEPAMPTTADLFADLAPAASHAGRPTGVHDATAFEIGWDFAHHRLTPPPQVLAGEHPVHQGWQAGRAVFGARTLKPTPPVRQWLQLRLDAWRRGCAFEGVQVTPNFLAQIDVALCPITRVEVTQASGAGSDAAAGRLCHQAGYAAGNLAVMSTRAIEAMATLGWRDALAVVRQLEFSGLDTLDGLDAAAWSRLAVLMSFATPLSHAEAAALPLRVLPPNRVRLLNAVQGLQAVVTLAFTQDQAVPRLRALAAQMPGAARHHFQVFVLTLQARRLGLGQAVTGPALRHALEDLWTDAAVPRRWQRFALQLSEADCERLLRHALRRGLGGSGWQWLPRAAATDGWALVSEGDVGARSPWLRPPVKQVRLAGAQRNALPIASRPAATRASYSRSSMAITTSES